MKKEEKEKSSRYNIESIRTAIKNSILNSSAATKLDPGNTQGLVPPTCPH